MSGWRAVVPLKLGPDSKSRLAGLLLPDERTALVERMARHVLAALAASGRFDEIVLLSPERPSWWDGAWAADTGRGLNDELMAWRAAQDSAPVLVIHADLPLLTAPDVAALLDAAEEKGIALAPDRVGEGSNALAIADGRGFYFRFGRGSRVAHCDQAPAMPVLNTPGLSADLDIVEDLAFLRARGLVP